MEANSEIMQMLKLADKDFNTVIIIKLSEVEKDVIHNE